MTRVGTPVGEERESQRGVSEAEAPLTDDALDTDPVLRKILAELTALREDNAQMRAQLRDLRNHSNLVGHLVEMTRAEMRQHGLRRAIGHSVQFGLHGALGAKSWLRDIRKEWATASFLSARPDWDDGLKQWRRKRDPALHRQAFWQTARSAIAPSKRVLYQVRSHVPLPGPRPRIIHIMPNVFVGGSTQLVVDLMNNLGAHYDMQVVTAALPHGRPHPGMTTHIHPLPGDATTFEATIRALNPDLLHVHYWGDVDRPWYEAAFRAAENVGCPVLQNINTPVPPYDSPAIKANVFVSDSIRQLDHSKTVPGRVIYPGIDLSIFTPPTVSDPEARNSIGMVYRLEPDKLDADSILPFIEIVKRRPQTRAIIVGGGSLFWPFVERVKAAGVLDNFLFTGYVPFNTLPSWYSRFQIFVAPVVRESFGQVSPFAMAMGRVVAGARVGALPEILEDDETLGSSVDEIASKVVALLDDPVRMAELGERNQQMAREKFSLESMIRGYEKVYAELVEQPKDPMPDFPPAVIFRPESARG